MPIKPENKLRYPADWDKRSYFIRFVRGKGRCEWCGAVHGEPHPITGSKVVLTCAHVYDHRPEASSLLNLAGLCNYCHLNHDKEQHVASRQRAALNKKLMNQSPLFPELTK